MIYTGILRKFTTSPIGQEMGLILLAPHQLAHFWNCNLYALEDFPHQDESMSFIAFSESGCFLYLCLRYSTRLAGAVYVDLASIEGVLAGLAGSNLGRSTHISSSAGYQGWDFHTGAIKTRSACCCWAWARTLPTRLHGWLAYM